MCQSCSVDSDQRPDSKHFDFHENGIDSTGLKSESGIMKEYHTDTLCASKANEAVADHLPHMTNDADGFTARNLNHSTSLNDLAKDNERDLRDPEAPKSHSCGEMESFEDSVFYMDKCVTECELQELIVCYKEKMYHVKDICVDVGLRSNDRILLESNANKKFMRAFFSAEEEDKNSELMEEIKNSIMPVPCVLKSFAENDSDEDIVNQYDSLRESDSGEEDIVDRCDSKDLMPVGGMKDDATDKKITNDDSKNLFSLRDLFSMHIAGAENSQSKSSEDNALEAEKESLQFQGSYGEASLKNPDLACQAEELNGAELTRGSDLVSASEESHNGSGEAILANPDLVSAIEKAQDNICEASLSSADLVSEFDESTKISTTDNISYNSMMETGSITFDFDASATRARGNKEHLQIGDSQRFETMEIARQVDASCQSVSSQVHSGLGESSFSAVGSLPGLINYSGPVAYSGSVSRRSDSSTTSTHSFAFPILQSEWNSSPIRMAKADRRHYRKCKWRQGLLCCRF